MLRSVTRSSTVFVFAAALAVSGCQLSPQDQANLGLIGGAAGGVLLADALNANPQWTIVAGVAGATIGTLIARNAQTGQCAYYAGTNAQGQAVYNTGPC